MAPGSQQEDDNCGARRPSAADGRLGREVRRGMCSVRTNRSPQGRQNPPPDYSLQQRVTEAAVNSGRSRVSREAINHPPHVTSTELGTCVTGQFTGGPAQPQPHALPCPADRGPPLTRAEDAAVQWRRGFIHTEVRPPPVATRVTSSLTSEHSLTSWGSWRLGASHTGGHHQTP